MSTTTEPLTFDRIVLPISTIEGAGWRYNETDKENTKGVVRALLVIAAMFLGLFSMRFTVAVLGEIFGVLASVVITGTIIFFSDRVGEKVALRKVKKRDAYRKLHAPTILEALKEQGWKLARKGDDVKTLMEDDNPYLLNSDGVRYYAKYIDIYPHDVSIQVKLSDPKVESEMKERAKENQIDYLTRRHEASKGAMTAEQKELFQTALRMSL